MSASFPRKPAAPALRLGAFGPAALDLELPPGGRCALLGPAGAGKSALLAALAGLAPADGGTLEIAGRSARTLPPHRRGLALVLPGDGPLPGHGVAASVAFAAADRDLAGAALTAFGLTAVRDRLAGALSRAEAVRAALARAVATAAPLLLLDDPCAGLDQAEARGVLALLAAWLAAHPAAVLLATREPAQAFALGGEVALLAGGRLVQRGPVQAVFDAPLSPLAARLLGPVTLLPGTVATAEEDFATVALACGPVVEAAPVPPEKKGTACVLALRPRRIALSAGPAAEMGAGALPARLLAATPLGEEVRFELALGDPPATLTVLRPAGAPPPGAVGGEVAVAWQPDHARILSPMP